MGTAMVPTENTGDLDEGTVRRKAFDLIPQLPTDVDCALRVLGHAAAVPVPDDPASDRLSRGLATLARELTAQLNVGMRDRHRVLDYAALLIRTHLASGVSAGGRLPPSTPTHGLCAGG